jgi:hypothetical protein
MQMSQNPFERVEVEKHWTIQKNEIYNNEWGNYLKVPHAGAGRGPQEGHVAEELLGSLMRKESGELGDGRPLDVQHDLMVLILMGRAIP